MKLGAARATTARGAAEAGSQDLLEGIRRLADPKISLASVASMALGAAVAASGGPLAWGWLALTFIGIFGIEVAKNASGELVDFESGVDEAVSPEDRSPFSGGKRVLVEGLLTRRQTAAVSWLGYGVGIASGVILATYRHPGVLWLGLAGVGLAYFYHAAPARLSYALLYANDRIRVNSVHPGFIWTPMVENLLKSGGDVTAGRKAIDALHPLGHMGEPDDIAYGILYLASDESKFVTGSELVIDGGYTAR